MNLLLLLTESVAFLRCFRDYVCNCVHVCARVCVQSNDPSMIRSGPEETLQSHLLVFEAELSRLEERVVLL